MNVSEKLSENGYVVLRDLAGEHELERLRRLVASLEETAATKVRSAGDFVLEAEDVGGWVAWQQGADAVRGLLRSVSRVHEHRPELVPIATAMGLPDKWVRPVVDTDVELVNSFFWAKPTRLGSEKPWHQDMAFAPAGFTDRHRNVITVWVAVDPATAENGCLEFVPASHRSGLLPHVGHREREDGEPQVSDPVEPHIPASALSPHPPPVRVPLGAGSAVMFDGLIAHRSAPNRTTAPRRSVSFVYAVAA